MTPTGSELFLATRNVDIRCRKEQAKTGSRVPECDPAYRYRLSLAGRLKLCT